MDNLSYLIIEKGLTDSYYNSASLMNLFPNDPDFFGYTANDVHKAFSDLIEQNILTPHPIKGVTGGISYSKNYFLSDKGKKAYLKEKENREDKFKSDELQRLLAQTLLDANRSTIGTNESVKLTNQSVQTLNGIIKDNIPIQNKLTSSAIIVSAFAALVALATFFGTMQSQKDPALIKQLEETNKLLKNQENMLNELLQRQIKIDSVLIKSTTLPHH
jgi:hypothetical protein